MAQELRFDGRVAIVTGAGRGMGKEHARLLASRGAFVIVSDINLDQANTTVEGIHSTGGRAVAVCGSIAERSVANTIVQTAIEKFSRIDILINNAGIDIAKAFTEYTDEDLDRILDVHIRGSWLLSQLVWPHMMKQEYGRIILVASTSIFGMANNAAYVAAKGGLFGLGKALAVEGLSHGILVNCLGPVAFTPMAEEVVKDPTLRAWLSKAYPVNATSVVCSWLAHADCKLNGEFVTTYGQSIGRVFLAETRGIHCQTGPYTPETIRNSIDNAWDLKDFLLPTSEADRMQTLMYERTGSEEDRKILEAMFESVGN